MKSEIVKDKIYNHVKYRSVKIVIAWFELVLVDTNYKRLKIYHVIVCIKSKLENLHD